MLFLPRRGLFLIDYHLLADEVERTGERLLAYRSFGANTVFMKRKKLVQFEKNFKCGNINTDYATHIRHRGGNYGMSSRDIRNGHSTQKNTTLFMNLYKKCSQGVCKPWDTIRANLVIVYFFVSPCT